MIMTVTASDPARISRHYAQSRQQRGQFLVDELRRFLIFSRSAPLHLRWSTTAGRPLRWVWKSVVTDRQKNKWKSRGSALSPLMTQQPQPWDDALGSRYGHIVRRRRSLITDRFFPYESYKLLEFLYMILHISNYAPYRRDRELQGSMSPPAKLPRGESRFLL